VESYKKVNLLILRLCDSALSTAEGHTVLMPQRYIIKVHTYDTIFLSLAGLSSMETLKGKQTSQFFKERFFC
jgi:hypothetical protein